MILTQPPTLVGLLAHELRWTAVKKLGMGDYRVQELAEQLQQPMNLVSYHLKMLRDEGLVMTRRSEADGRDVYYHLNLPRLRTLYQDMGMALHPALLHLEAVDSQMSPRGLSVLFVCTHNSARSQMAEGLMRSLAGDRLQIASAGSEPSTIHPDCIRTMQTMGIAIEGQYAKALSEFEGQHFDYVITVCDRAREICPTFPAVRSYLHWGYGDPVKVQDAAEREQLFTHIARDLKTRIEYFLAVLSDAPIH